MLPYTGGRDGGDIKIEREGEHARTKSHTHLTVMLTSLVYKRRCSSDAFKNFSTAFVAFTRDDLSG